MQDTQNSSVTYIATTDSDEGQIAFGINNSDRQRHMLLLGEGSACDNILRNTMAQDILSDRPVLIFDFEGNISEFALRILPKHRTKETLFLRPDPDNILPLNILSKLKGKKMEMARDLIAETVAELSGNINETEKNVIALSVYALAYYPGANLLDLSEFVLDGFFMRDVLSQTDAIPKKQLHDALKVVDKEALSLKIKRVFEDVYVKAPLGQKHNVLQNMLSGDTPVVIIDLSEIPLDARPALARLVFTALYIELTEQQRAFQFFMSHLNELDAHALRHFIKHTQTNKIQITAHMSDFNVSSDLRALLFTEFGNVFVSHMSANDAELVVSLFEPYFDIKDITELAEKEILINMLVNDEKVPPFKAEALDTLEYPDYDFSELIKSSSKDYLMEIKKAVSFLETHLRARTLAFNMANAKKEKPASGGSVEKTRIKSPAQIMRERKKEEDKPAKQPAQNTSRQLSKRKDTRMNELTKEAQELRQDELHTVLQNILYGDGKDKENDA